MLSKMINKYSIKSIHCIILLMGSFVLYAAEEPPAQVKVLFVEEGEQVPKGRLPVLTIDISRFPFFAGYGHIEGKGKIIKTHMLSYPAMVIATNLDDLMRKDYDIIQRSFKHGTYIIPHFNEIMSQYEISFADIPNLMEHINAIDKNDLAPLIGYEYARQLTQNPIMHEDIDIQEGEASEDAAKRYITFESTLEAQIAKMILDYALIKKAQYNCSDNKVWFDILEKYMPPTDPLKLIKFNIKKEYHKLPIDVGVDALYYLCPTNFADNLIFVKTKRMEYTSQILKVFSGKLKNESTYDPGIFGQKYKMPICDYSYDNERKVAVIIDADATSKLKISYLFERPHFYGLIQEEETTKEENTTNQKEINLGTEDDVLGSKLIFEPNKDKDGHIFYLKFKNDVYKGNADERTINLQEPIDSTNITDAWVKKYLTDDDAMVHSCPAVAYAEAQTEPFFNTRCLHALCFEDVGNDLMKALSEIYRSKSISIVQCTCDPKNDSHYYLLTVKYGNSVEYKVASIRFKPDERMQKLLDFMNTLKKEKDENTYLIPNALYIYWLYTQNFTLQPEEISKKMGILDQFVSPRLKSLFIPAPPYVPERPVVYNREPETPPQPTSYKSFMKRGVEHIIGSWIKPNIGYIKTFGILSAGAIGYTLLNRLSNDQRNKVFSGMLILGLAHLGMLKYFHNK